MPMPLFLLFLLCNPSFFAEDFEGKRRENVDFALHSGAERTPVDARRRRGRVLRVRIVLYSGSIEGLSERDIRKIKHHTPAPNLRCSPSNFQAATAKRTSADARRRRGRVLRVNIVV